MIVALPTALRNISRAFPPACLCDSLPTVGQFPPRRATVLGKWNLIGDISGFECCSVNLLCIAHCLLVFIYLYNSTMNTSIQAIFQECRGM